MRLAFRLLERFGISLVSHESEADARSLKFKLTHYPAARQHQHLVRAHALPPGRRQLQQRLVHGAAAIAFRIECYVLEAQALEDCGKFRQHSQV